MSCPQSSSVALPSCDLPPAEGANITPAQLLAFADQHNLSVDRAGRRVLAFAGDNEKTVTGSGTTFLEALREVHAAWQAELRRRLSAAANMQLLDR